MFKKLISSNAARAVLYAILATPFLLLLNYVSPGEWRAQLSTMPPLVQALVLLNGVMSLYILAARRTMLPILHRR
jgi:hypothetical protein